MIIKFVKNKLDKHSSSPPIFLLEGRVLSISIPYDFSAQVFTSVSKAASPTWNAHQWGYSYTAQLH